MSSNSLVVVESVSKKYCRSLRQSMLYAAVDISRDTIGLRSHGSTLRPGEFWAVDDVSFEVKRGECLGIIGANGAGKSTLLKMLNGIVRPDRGTIRMRGRVGALIEVGAGFHPMLSGRENIYVNGAILGMSRREIDRKFDEIVDFAELSSGVLDAPVKTYSSGMYVRLGFAIAVHSEPDVLLVDEVLSVGDIRFRGKSYQRITEMRDSGTAIILVTHHQIEVERMCRNALRLESGRVISRGVSQYVTADYRKSMLTSLDARVEPGADLARRGSGDAPGLLSVEVGMTTPVSGNNFEIGDWCPVTVSLVQDEGGFDGELRMWLWRTDLDIPVGTAAIPWKRVRGMRLGEPLHAAVRLMGMPGTYRVGVQIRGLGIHDYADQLYSREFLVTANRASYPFVPAAAVDNVVLEVRL